jgi:ABC-type dipeptide/oligopeptide/nickel transport system permease subunit
VSTAADQVTSTEITGRSLAQIAWSRLRRDRTFILSSVILIVILLMALFAPVITGLIGVDPYSLDKTVIDTSGGKPIGPWGGASIEHPLGVEWGTGRDIMARLLYGLRISLLIAFSATILVVVLGTLFGIISGYARGWVDGFLGRFMDLILAFPFLLIILALSGSLTQRLTALGVPEGNASRITYLILVLGVFGWPYLARIVRGEVLSLREREFVESAVSIGASTPRILVREILPNLWAPILVYATLLLPVYIAVEAVLSFLGIGVLPPEPSFGAMLADSVQYFTLIPSYLFIPGTLLVIVVVAFNLVGDSIRDALDPKAVDR